MSKLTQEQVDDMLLQLRDHFGEPVKPVSEYCKAFYDWQKVLGERIALDKAALEALPESITSERIKELYQDRHSLTDEEKAATNLYYLRSALEGSIKNWEETTAALSRLYLPIVKSNFLARHVYDKEPLRTLECPEHKGHWSGCVWGDQSCEYGCMYGSNVTGWLREEHHYTRPPKDVQDRINADIEKHPHLVIHYPERCWICGGTEDKGLHV